MGGVIIIFAIASIYSCLPRVWHKQSSYGISIAPSKLLSAESKTSLIKYINDTANNAQAVVVIKDEKIILATGATEKLINCHSARKSIMSLLIGIAKEKGMLKLDETIGSLGINESRTPLTEQEKTATIRDLLMAKSGVYLPAEAETDFAKKNRPTREQYKPGEFFFYNNFDFNVLGTILEKKSGMSIGAFMEKYLAIPLGMEHFAASNIVYGNPWPMRKEKSDNRVYWIFLSAGDFARIGAMVAQKGKWHDQQIVSAAWINESVKRYTDSLDSKTQSHDGYGYLWWSDNDGTIWADGWGGQFLQIDTAHNLVIAQRNFTGNSLLSSGLFFMKKNRDGYRSDVRYLRKRIVENLR